MLWLSFLWEDKMECPICEEKIDEDLENVFNHLRYQHDDDDTHKLLIATLDSLAQMNLNSYYYKGKK